MKRQRHVALQPRTKVSALPENAIDHENTRRQKPQHRALHLHPVIVLQRQRKRRRDHQHDGAKNGEAAEQIDLHKALQYHQRESGRCTHNRGQREILSELTHQVKQRAEREVSIDRVFVALPFALA